MKAASSRIFLKESLTTDRKRYDAIDGTFIKMREQQKFEKDVEKARYNLNVLQKALPDE